MRPFLFFAVLVTGLAIARCPSVVAQQFDYQAQVFVSEESQLDWVYALKEESPASQPANLAANYRSSKQSYEFYGPTGFDDLRHPLIIDISPQNQPKGWYFWQPICREQGVVYAGLRGMGNGVPFPIRVRATLDVLDDVRKRCSIDPDRTYIVGFSGGAPVACRVAFRLPEYFGGAILIASTPSLPESPWLIDRVKEKLSVMLIAGERESAGPLNEQLYLPLLTGLGIRTDTIILRRRGHVMADTPALADAFEWLEADADARKEHSVQSSTASTAHPPSREEWSQKMLSEAKLQLADPGTKFSGLNQLEIIAHRWPDLPAAKEGKELIASHSETELREWQNEISHRRAEISRLKAEGYERLARVTPKPLRNTKNNLLLDALAHWQQVSNEVPNSDPAGKALQHIKLLKELVGSEPLEFQPQPVESFRFRMVGTVTVEEGIEYLSQAIEPLGYEVTFDADEAKSQGIDFDRKFHLNLPNARFSDIKNRFIKRAGLKVVREGSQIQLVPIKSSTVSPPNSPAQ